MPGNLLEIEVQMIEVHQILVPSMNDPNWHPLCYSALILLFVILFFRHAIVQSDEKCLGMFEPKP